MMNPQVVTLTLAMAWPGWSVILGLEGVKLGLEALGRAGILAYQPPSPLYDPFCVMLTPF